MKKTMSRALSLILAVVMLAMAMPIAFAATPIALKASNVTEWPTAFGEMYVGQIVGEYITISGGTVEYNGVTVPGKFVHYKEDAVITTASDTTKASIKFVPDDSSAYKGFNKLLSSDVTYKVYKTTPVLSDENNPPIATSIEEGQTLSASIISGGTMKNPYNDTLDLSGTVWTWENPDLVLTESGEYSAKWEGNTRAYEVVTKKIYVEVLKDVSETEISVVPTVELTYNPNTTWADVNLDGGKAVVKGETTEVSGFFAVTSKWSSKVPVVGSYEIDATFTPDDTSAYTSVDFKIPVTVNAASITFETEDGTGVPTITVDYGKKTNDDMGLMLKQYVPEDVQIQYIDFYGLDGQLLEHANKTYDPGSYTFTCRARTQNKNYATTMLTFNVVINKVKINPQIEGNGNRMIIRDVSGQYNPKGTFDLYINDELVKEDIPYNEYFTWEHTTSGDKNFKAVYNPGDDNRYEIDPITRNDTGIILEWNVVANNTEIAPKKYAYNSAVTLAAPAYDPATPDKPYYGFAGWEDVNGNTGLTEEQLKNAEITFTMPDADVELKATYKFSIKLFFEWILAQITQFFTFIVNAVKDLIALA